MEKRKILAIVLAICFVFAMCCACSNGSENQGTDTSVNSDNMFTDRDLSGKYDENSSTKITLNGDSASCSSKNVVVSAGQVTIQSEGTYILSGTLNDGQVVVDTDKNSKVQIVLKNATISSNTSSPIYVKQADKVFVTLAEGTTNSLTNVNPFVAIDENNIDAVVFSKDDLTLNGTGNLSINTQNGHGIASKDSLVVAGCSLNINCSGKGLSGNDDVKIASGNFEITSGKDGIFAENTEDTSLGFVYIANGNFKITAQQDGISASSTLKIKDGNFDITTASGASDSDMQAGGMMQPDMNTNGGGTAPSDMGGMTPPDMNVNGGGTAPSDMGGMAPPDMNTNGGGTAPSDMGEMMQPDMNANGEGTAPSDMGGMTPPNMDINGGGTNPDTNSNSTSTDTISTKGIKSTGDMTIENGTFNFNTADDAIHSNANIEVNDGTYTIATGDDGIHSDSSVEIKNGNIAITKCYEGIEGANVTISNGNIDIVSSDDGLNAAGGNDTQTNARFDMFASSDKYSIDITGGKITINASGDGIDSNGTLKISGGEVYVDGPYSEGDNAVDWGERSTGEISGGILIASGMADMQLNLSDSSTQCSIFYQFVSGSKTANSKVTLTDKDGNEIASYTPKKSFDNVIISTPELEENGTYTITCGDESETITLSGKQFSNKQKSEQSTQNNDKGGKQKQDRGFATGTQ